MESKIQRKIKVILWSFTIAWKVDKYAMIIWFGISILISVLPSLGLLFNQQILEVLSTYLANNIINFSKLWSNILGLSIVLILQGISKRVNGEVLYLIMYDAYYLGMENYVMETLQKVDVLELMNKENKDEYNATIRRCGSLNDFMSNFCIFFSKSISIFLLLFISSGISKLISLFILIYIIVILALDIAFAEKAWIDYVRYREYEHHQNYYQNIVMNSGVAKEIRIFKMKDQIVKLWKDAYKEVERVDKKVLRSKSYISLYSELGLYICIILIMLVSMRLVLTHKMTVDVFFMLYYLGQNLSGIMREMTSSLLESDRGLAALERQKEFVEKIIEKSQDDICQPICENGSEDDLIILEDVTFSYDGKENILENINLKIKKGEVIALVGVNGSGKSTLAKIISGIYNPTAGKIFWKGKEYRAGGKEEMRKGMGITFQDFFLFHASMRENVGVGEVSFINDIAKINRAIKKGGADEVIKKNGGNLEKWIGRDVKKDGLLLSGGEKQKIAVSRAYMGDKDIYVFDEPAAALDPIAEMQQFMRIQNRISDKTAILVSHRVGFARMADKIVVMEHGKIVEVGTHEKLMSNNMIYAGLYRKQAEGYSDSNYEIHKNSK